MTGSERKIKQRVQLIVAASMFVFFSLCIILGVQLSIMANQNRLERDLVSVHNSLNAQIEGERNQERWMLSERFIEEFALRELGYGRDGAQIFN